MDDAGRAVACRTIINRKCGSVIVFSFDENGGISEHTSPSDAMMMIPDSECEARVAGSKFPMNAGETIIFPAGSPHALSAVSKFRMNLVLIKG